MIFTVKNQSGFVSIFKKSYISSQKNVPENVPKLS